MTRIIVILCAIIGFTFCLNHYAPSVWTNTLNLGALRVAWGWICLGGFSIAAFGLKARD